jgi:hypothetical protein
MKVRRAATAAACGALLAFGIATSAGASAPPGATAQCRDGSYSRAVRHQGACSHHGGVAHRLDVSAAPAAGAKYSRAAFGPAWADVDHNGCDTRDDILRRDLKDIRFRDGSACVVATGVLRDPYTGRTIHFVRGVRTSELVQIDHVVALSDAWRDGAARWTPAERERFANDPLVLLAVDGSENESKGDDDAAEWLPPNRGFDCPYVRRQLAIKRKYRLTIRADERAAIRRTLAAC